MNDTTSLLLATLVLGISGLGIYMCSSSNSFLNKNTYNEDILFKSPKSKKKQVDDNDDDSETDESGTETESELNDELDSDDESQLEYNEDLDNGKYSGKKQTIKNTKKK